MPLRRRQPAAIAVALVVVAIIGACTATIASPSATAPSAPASSAASASSRPSSSSGPSPAVTAAPTIELTPVPGGASGEPNPPPGQPGTTETDWGTILDTVPDDFPVYPGAEPAELPEGPLSGALLAPDDVETVASWYRDRLEAEGYTIDNLSSPLEDGTRVMDIVTDLPECRIQQTFRPADGSTMVVILYGAGCRFTGG